MTDVSKNELVGILRSLGHVIPEPDVTETWHRLSALIEAMRSFDTDEFHRAEPLPTQPLRTHR